MEDKYIKDTIDNLYKFSENPSLFFKESLISLFVSNSLVSTQLITGLIDKNDIIITIKKNDEEKAYVLLRDILDREFRELSDIEQEKIEICKRKLKDIVSIIYSNYRSYFYKCYKNEKSEKVKVKEHTNMTDFKKSTKLSAKYRNEVTWNGYTSDIMKSGLQKYIRRGLLDKAIYCAGELDLFKEADDNGETIRTNFLHRLMIIYMEDVENMSIFNKIDSLINKLFKEREKSSRNKENEEEWIYDIVYLLTYSEKARVCSHIRAVFNSKYKKLLDVYPSIKKLWDEIEENYKKTDKNKSKLENDCILFKKYLREKNILCCYYAFQIDMSEDKLKVKYFRSNKPVWSIFNQLLSISDNKDRINKFVEWYKNHIGKMKEGFLCWLFPLLYEIGVIPYGKSVELDDDEKKQNWDRNRSGETIDIDDYVVDRHTKAGRGKGLVEFAVKGAFVENEASFVNLLWKSFYDDGKRFEDGEKVLGELDFKEKKRSPKIITDDEDEEPSKSPKKSPKIITDDEKISLETELYDFIVLTQITTSGMKQDVYFARDISDNKLVVVKGPYSEKSQIDILVRNTEWKKKNKLPYIPFKIVKMIPNRWPEGIPLGFRNTIDRSKPAFFVVFDSVVPEQKLKKKIHSSKVWPETEVVDWDKIPLHFEYKSGMRTNKEMFDYVKAILFRYIRGISDFADRNFLLVDGRVISIDEDIELRDVNIYKELRKNKADYVNKWLKKNENLVLEEVRKWVGYDNEYEKKRLEEVKNKEKILEMFRE